jgi:hypothetical protein
MMPDGRARRSDKRCQGRKTRDDDAGTPAHPSQVARYFEGLIARDCRAPRPLVRPVYGLLHASRSLDPIDDRQIAHFGFRLCMQPFFLQTGELLPMDRSLPNNTVELA